MKLPKGQLTEPRPFPALCGGGGEVAHGRTDGRGGLLGQAVLFSRNQSGKLLGLLGPPPPPRAQEF